MLLVPFCGFQPSLLPGSIAPKMWFCQNFVHLHTDYAKNDHQPPGSFAPFVVSLTALVSFQPTVTLHGCSDRGVLFWLCVSQSCTDEFGSQEVYPCIPQHIRWNSHFRHSAMKTHPCCEFGNCPNFANMQTISSL